MRELNARHRPLRLHELRDSRQRLGMVVAPNADVARRDPTLGHHGRRLDDDQRHTAGRATPQMHEVPIVGETIARDVLAHRRHRDSIAKREAADLERAQQVDLRDLAIVVAAGRAAVRRSLGVLIGGLNGHRRVSPRTDRSLCLRRIRATPKIYTGEVSISYTKSFARQSDPPAGGLGDVATHLRVAPPSWRTAGVVRPVMARRIGSRAWCAIDLWQARSLRAGSLNIDGCRKSQRVAHASG